MKFRKFLSDVFEGPVEISAGDDDRGEAEASLEEEMAVPHATDNDEPEPERDHWAFGGRR